MNAICLVIDRLHTGFLGTYGNAWVETPAIDRMASQSCVFDNALIDTPRLRGICHSYWQGMHSLSASFPDHGAPLPAEHLGSERGPFGALHR